MDKTAKLCNNNVCAEIVVDNLCIGCGVCVGVCPSKNLVIKFNEFGEFTPYNAKDDCLENCDLCLGSCPFYDQAENEDTLASRIFSDVPEIKYRSETGYYLETFVGYSTVNAHRQNGASGGLATCMLEKLLEMNLVDRVACVSQTKEPGKLYKYVLCSACEDVRACAGSCYYPVETSDIVQHILTHGQYYAIIGLPCYIKAFRLAMKKNSALKRRVRFLLGLVCGQTKSSFFAEYICALGGGNPHQLKEFKFRVKDKNRPAHDYGMKSACGDDIEAVNERTTFLSEGISQIWIDRYFTPNPCNFCDDVFAELADITFMDAWLPDFSKEPEGHSIVIVRNKEMLNIFLKGISKGTVMATELDIGRVIQSQEGVLDSKRGEIQERIRLSKLEGKKVPQKRLHLCNNELSFGSKLVVKATWFISQQSRIKWPGSGRNLQQFERGMVPYSKRMNKARQIERFMRISQYVFKGIKRLLSW